ncbi:MAG: hypothetical protein IKK73_08655 [Akkermansia sp.]|nr:hypothetical protein [Akkermansia sp.]MBR6577183.1 hypothetical protein [Akkermansia sp.]
MKTESTSTRNRRRPFIKVCGQTYTGSVDCAAAYGAEYIGFNFCPGSTRFVSPAHAAGMPSAHVKRVGVFAGQGAEEICRIMQQARLHLAQLQGEQTPQDARVIGPQRVIRKLNIQGGRNAADVQAELDAWAPFCSAYLVECMDAALVAQLQFPHPWMLSGRMPGRILHDMVQTCRPDGVDIDSCVDCADTMACMRAIA